MSNEIEKLSERIQELETENKKHLQTIKDLLTTSKVNKIKA
jgi:cell division protein FtsL